MSKERSAFHLSSPGLFRAGEQGTALSVAKGERRAPFRPQFVSGWRKCVASTDPNESTKCESSAASPIYVWTSRVETLLASSANFHVLDREDIASLQSLRSSNQRNVAMAARILLRLSLSQMIDRCVAPNEWRFERTALGKLQIVGNTESLSFSISHAGPLVMVAVGRNVRVGVDVECVDQEIEETIVSEFCHVVEQQTLQSLPVPQRLRTFIQMWTQKEAYTKMLGLGHTLDFRSFSLAALQESGELASNVIVEGFYFSLEQCLYHAALVIERAAPYQPVDIQLMTAVLPSRDGRRTCATPMSSVIPL